MAVVPVYFSSTVRRTKLGKGHCHCCAPSVDMCCHDSEKKSAFLCS